MNQNTAIQEDALHLKKLGQQVDSRESFVGFLDALIKNFQQKPEEWENRDLASFLNAMAAWIEDMDGYYQNQGEPVPERPSWKVLGEILLAARIYEQPFTGQTLDC
jgi:hypothetical protein